MEQIYPLKHCSTENINLKSYFENYSSLFNHKLQESNLPNNQDDLIKQEMLNLLQPNSTESNLNIDLPYLKNDCNIDKLQCINEGKPVNIPEKLHRQSKMEMVYKVPKLVNNLEILKCKKELESEINMDALLNYRRGTFKTSLVSTNQTLIQDITPYSDYILTVLAYKPFQIFYNATGPKSTPKMSFNFELQVLGSNTLVEMIDKFECPADKVLFKEVENTNIDLKTLVNAREKYPSRFVFIDGVFYNDFRSPNSIDYSKTIIDWANEKNIGNFKSISIDKVKLNEITPKLGYPYVFMHQGNCEHLFVFSDARLIQTTDCLYTKMYPRLTETPKQVSVLCFLCGTVKPTWFCTNCDRFPQEKVLLCTECCNSYNFIDGKKIGNFKLYPYYNE